MRKTITTLGVTLATLALFTGCETADKAEKPVAKASATPTEEAPTEEPTEEPVEEPAGTVPTKRNFVFRVKTTEKECFGSAGCNVGIQLTPKWVGVGDPTDLDADYDITYRITGGEDGPIIGTFTMYSNGKYDMPDEEYIGTRSTNTVIKAQVTLVEETAGW
jgi:hypothetical protein